MDSMSSLNRLEMLSYIIGIVLFLAASLGVAFKGWLEWRIHGIGTDSGVKGRVYFITGVVGFALSILGIIVYFSYYEPMQEITTTYTAPPEDVDLTNSSSPTSNSSSSFFKSNYSYDNSTYTGYMNPETMVPNGEGTMIYSNKDEYSGNWIEGVRTGFGIMRYRNGDVYEGNWENDLKHGQECIYTWKDGKRYEGSYQSDKRHGQGTFYGWIDLSNGWEGTYIGDIVNDSFEGQGTFEFINGDVFIGEFRANKRWNGTYYYKNGTQFEVVNGEPH